MTKNIHIHSIKETLLLASRFAKLAQVGDVLTLNGNLGAGKTEFARAFVRAKLGPEMVVQSPTFNLVNVYDDVEPALWHFDLYRLKSSEEVWELGIEEAFAEGVTLIEWPERLGGMRLKNQLDITIEILEGEKRIFHIVADESWHGRLENIDVMSADAN